jgi:hypothetical protein
LAKKGATACWLAAASAGRAAGSEGSLAIGKGVVVPLCFWAVVVVKLVGGVDTEATTTVS